MFGHVSFSQELIIKINNKSTAFCFSQLALDINAENSIDEKAIG